MLLKQVQMPLDPARSSGALTDAAVPC